MIYLVSQRAGFFDFVGGRRFGAVDAHFGVPLDVVDLKEFAAGDEGDGASAAAGASGATDAVDVIFDVVGEVVVENPYSNLADKAPLLPAKPLAAVFLFII